MTETAPNFSAWEVLLALVMAVAAQAAGLFLLRTGGGTHALPDGLRLDLELLDERRFAGGVVYMRYRTRS